MTAYEAKAMHQAGDALFAVVDHEPNAAVCVQMDLGVFYRITEFVAGGAFIVGRKGDYAEGRANGDSHGLPCAVEHRSTSGLSVAIIANSSLRAPEQPSEPNPQEKAPTPESPESLS